MLWDPENGPRRLDAAHSRAVYYQVARILTHYLNLETFEGITAWHHAAGDFVVRIDADAVEVRLISVRDYRPLFPARPEPADSPRAAASFLETLLIFLLNLSIRTRLDRLDGTGELAWAGPESVAATVEGVLDSLAAKPAPVELPLPMDLLFRRFLAACREEDLLDLCQAIAARDRSGWQRRAAFDGKVRGGACRNAGRRLQPALMVLRTAINPIDLSLYTASFFPPAATSGIRPIPSFSGPRKAPENSFFN